MTYIKTNNTLYPATISGKMQDNAWDGRETKQITAAMDFAVMDELFADNCIWSIISEQDIITTDESGNEIITQETVEFDNSAYCIRGDITKHTNGTCTVVMGKPTDLEDAYELLYGEE